MVEIIELKQKAAFTDTNLSLTTGEQHYRVDAEPSIRTMLEMYRKADGNFDIMQAWIAVAHERINENTNELHKDRLRRLLDATLIDVMNNPES